MPKQVKPGFTNYQPRGLDKRILIFLKEAIKNLKNSEKYKKNFEKYPTCHKISKLFFFKFNEDNVTLIEKNSKFIPHFPYNHLFINFPRKRGEIEKTI